MSRRREDLRITWIGFGVNLALTVIKTAAGYFLNSRALIADGMHSLLDLLSDVAVLFGLFMARRPEDASHPYGHHRFATLSRLFLGGGLVLFAFGLVSSAALGFGAGPDVPEAGLAALIALLSLPVKEWLFWRTRKVARDLKSDLVMANAWHHRCDSLSSLGVAAALFGVWLGGEQWAFLDDGITLFLGGYLVFEAGKIFYRALVELVDTAPRREIIEDFREHILSTPGAEAYHDFRVRKVGDVYEVDFHLQVSPELTVEAGHSIAKAVKERLLAAHPEVWRVLIHIEPANTVHLLDRGVSGSS
ncbi:MAG: cation diffusion facilitator family transporter [Coraliomargaritaceae bacterium]